MIRFPKWLPAVAFALAIAHAGAWAAPDAAGLVQRSGELERLHSLLVLHRGRPVVEHVQAGPGLDRPASIKSLSKTVLSGIAIDRGFVSSPDRPVVEVLERDPPTADPRIGRITLGHALSLRGGLRSTSGRYYGAWVQSEDWVRHVLTRPFAGDGDVNHVLAKAARRNDVAVEFEEPVVGTRGVEVAAAQYALLCDEGGRTIERGYDRQAVPASPRALQPFARETLGLPPHSAFAPAREVSHEGRGLTAVEKIFNANARGTTPGRVLHAGSDLRVRVNIVGSQDTTGPMTAQAGRVGQWPGRPLPLAKTGAPAAPMAR